MITQGTVTYFEESNSGTQRLSSKQIYHNISLDIFLIIYSYPSPTAYIVKKKEFVANYVKYSYFNHLPFKYMHLAF